MTNLMTIARIGRSLGIHLILATQKPSGVVNDQIWSNSKFRICLKVQDRADSLDMIKRDDAANIKDVGKFYLQVGYNELFKLGQSAWCGIQYNPSDKLKKVIDTSICFVDNTGYALKKIDSDKKEIATVNYGDELTNIVSYLYNLSKELKLRNNSLWLDALPAYINVDKLKIKYNYTKDDYNINLIIGEYDIPNKQQQKLLTVNLTKDGNIGIYGVADSGKEELLSTLVYSAITSYSPNEVNFYIIDLGSETLGIYSKMPHIGDIALASDGEKIKNLFKLLNNEKNKRKKLFANYGGNFTEYNSKSNNHIPNFVIIINNYDAFIETYSDYEEIIVSLSRDCVKLGISFVVTSNTATGIRYRLRQNFKTELALRLNDTSDYGYILPGARKMIPAKTLGRGLIGLDNVYEFQTAFISEDSQSLSKIIDELAIKLNSTYSNKAKKIPVLPDIVTLDIVKEKISTINNVPVGIDSNKLDIVTADLKANKGFIITGNELSGLKSFTSSLIKELRLINNLSVIVIDSANLLDCVGDKLYFNSNFDNVFNSLNNYYKGIKKITDEGNKSILDKYSDIICFIIDSSNFISKLEENNSHYFEELINNIAEISKINFVFIESLNSLKSLEYEEWFNEICVLNNAIWVGNGIDDQFTIKVASGDRSLAEAIGNTMGYYVKVGTPIKVKLLQDENINEEDL